MAAIYQESYNAISRHWERPEAGSWDVNRWRCNDIFPPICRFQEVFDYIAMRWIIIFLEYNTAIFWRLLDFQDVKIRRVVKRWCNRLCPPFVLLELQIPTIINSDSLKKN